MPSDWSVSYCHVTDPAGLSRIETGGWAWRICFPNSRTLPIKFGREADAHRALQILLSQFDSQAWIEADASGNDFCSDEEFEVFIAAVCDVLAW